MDNIYYTIEELGGALPNLSKGSEDAQYWLSVSELRKLSGNFCSLTKMRSLVQQGAFGKVLKTFNNFYVKTITVEQINSILMNLAKGE